MKTEIRKAVFFGKTVYQVYFETQMNAGLVGNYPTLAAAGLPKYYAMFGSQYTDINEMSLILGPTPDQNYNVEMHYYYYPPTIVQGQITVLGTITAGSLYTNGVYQNIIKYIATPKL